LTFLNLMVTGRKEEDELFLRELPAVTAGVTFVNSYDSERISNRRS